MFTARLTNDSDNVLHDVELRMTLPSGERLTWSARTVQASRRVSLNPARAVEDYGLDELASNETQLPYEICFTDIFRDRWLIDSTKRVRLLEEARFELPSD